MFARPAVRHSFDEHILSAIILCQVVQNLSPVYSVVVVVIPGILPASTPEGPYLDRIDGSGMTRSHSTALNKSDGIPAPDQAWVGDGNRGQGSRAHCCCLET